MTNPLGPTPQEIFDSSFIVENPNFEEFSPGFEGGTPKRIVTPHSAEWGDWFGVHWDLVRTMEFCEEGMKLGDGDEHETLGNALVLAAIMSYARPFSEGVRVHAKLDISVLKGLGDALKAHQHFLDLRNKYIAHSVNSHEQNDAFVVLADPPLPRAIQQVSHMHLQSTPLNAEGFSVMLRLASVLDNQAEEHLERLRDLVFQEAHEMNLTQLYNFPKMMVKVPGVESAGKSRIGNGKSRSGKRRRQSGGK